jgi:hypothetical protein
LIRNGSFFASGRVFVPGYTSLKVRDITVKMPRPRSWHKAWLSAIIAIAVSAAAGARAQDSQQPAPGQPGTAQRGQRGQFAGMQRVNGEVTAVNGSTLTIKNEDGVAYQVTVTDNTRIMKGRGETVKAADIKVGDGLVAMGNLDTPNKTLHAAMVMATDAATLKAMKDNLGKTYITGRVTAIDVDNAKMTIERPDKVAQTIGFDETTSFKRGRGQMLGGIGSGNGNSIATPPADSGESITLADIKVGDTVTGQGSLKSNVFVPTQLMVATPGQIPRRNRDGSVPAVRLGAPTPPPQ